MVAFIFSVLGKTEAAAFARKLHDELRAAVRTHLIDKDARIADTDCQTSQTMALYYGVFDEAEKRPLFNRQRTLLI